MLTPRLPEDNKKVAVVPQSPSVVAVEGDGRQLMFVMPPLEDLAEIEGFRPNNFSLSDFVELRSSAPSGFEEMYAALALKKAKYPDSPTYLSKLASVASLTKRSDEALALLSRAAQLANEDYFVHRRGDELIRQGDESGGERLFASLDLDRDLGANLRLAAFSARRSDFSRAHEFVAKALSIDFVDFGARLFDGALHLVSGSFERAVQSLRVALQERPESSSAHANLAIAFLGLRQSEKAIVSLKKAVALDPLSKNAVGLLADVCAGMNRPEDAIPGLRYYLSFEQRDPGMWSRLARASFSLKNYDEAILALKRQASISETGEIWNNLGVSYLEKNSRELAWKAFHHSYKLEAESRSRTFFLAAKNIGRMLADAGEYSKLERFVGGAVSLDTSGAVFSDPDLSDLVALHVYSVSKTSGANASISAILDYLSEERVSDTLSLWLVGTLVGVRALWSKDQDLDSVIAHYGSRADDLLRTKPDRAERFYNNLAYALAEVGRTSEAEKVLQKVAPSIRTSPYPTATWGLIQMRRGRVDRAKELYEKAIRLAVGRDDKVRIRQKMNLELGKHWSQLDRSKSLRFLTQAIDKKYGEDAVSSEAQRLKRAAIEAKTK